MIAIPATITDQSSKAEQSNIPGLPQPTLKIAPDYPDITYEGGTTRVMVRIDETGSVANAGVVSSSGNRDIDRAAWKAALQWKFDVSGPDKKFPIIATIPFNFLPHQGSKHETAQITPTIPQSSSPPSQYKRAPGSPLYVSLGTSHEYEPYLRDALGILIEAAKQPRLENLGAHKTILLLATIFPDGTIQSVEVIRGSDSSSNDKKLADAIAHNAKLPKVSPTMPADLPSLKFVFSIQS